MGVEGHPINTTHPGNMTLVGDYEGTMMVYNPFIRYYFLGRHWHWCGVPLNFHDMFKLNK